MPERINGHPAQSLFLVLLTICAVIAVLVPGLSQDQAPKVKVEKGPAREMDEVSGSKLFHYYCAACHGQGGKGDGPAASGLKTQPIDLTLLAKKNGGKFPSDHVMYVLNSESEYTLHGSKDMPIWGPIFRKMGANQSLGVLRARNVMEYLKSIQAK